MVWLQVFLKAWNFFIELQDYKFYVQNYEFWSFGENPHIFKLTPINVCSPIWMNNLDTPAIIAIFENRLPAHLKRGVATMPLLVLLLKDFVTVISPLQRRI